MSLIHLTYTPTGRLWTRVKHAIFTAYVNWHIRHAERRDTDYYVQLKKAEIK